MTEQRVLDGRYEVGELIGRGGMADVHLGRDVRLGRSVAIKLLRPDLARDPQFQSRFRREAQAVAGLNHPSIVSVYDTGDHHTLDGDGFTESVTVPFIVMEYVAGKTLRDLVRSKEISIDQAVEHSLGVLSALEYSHRSGIVHRDIKPANVIITPDDSVKVMDFGIARAVADSAATMTQTQAVIGTAQYLSPEQARGETVDARSDLYSAACLLYEMFTGRPPFVGESAVSVAYQHVREIPERPSHFNADVSEALDSVLTRALQKDREERFQDAAAFRRALRAARTGVTLAPLAPAAPDQNPATNATVPLVAAAAAGAHADGAQTEAMPHAGSPEDAYDAEPHTRAMPGVGAGGAASGGVDDWDTADSGPIRFDDREDEPRRKKRRGGWIAVLIVALIVVLSAGGYFLYSTLTAEPPPPPLVQVPDVGNMTEAEAVTVLYERQLEPKTERVENDDVAEGLAIETSPETGAKVGEGSVVELLISSGPGTVTIPENLQGQSESAVRDRLQQAGLVGGSTESVNSPSVSSGSVIATEPGLGETIPAESTVDLVVSTGNVTVPAMTGQQVVDAEAALQDPAVSLPYSIEKEENSDVKPGTVVEQSAPGGTDVEQGTEIVLTVAAEPEKEKPEKEKPEKDESSASPSPTPTGQASGTPEE